MKRLFVVLAVMALIVSTAGMTVFAHGGHHRSRDHHRSKIVYFCEKGCTYTDDDMDGICDECGNCGYYCQEGCSFADEDGDGFCDECDNKGVCSVKRKVKGHCGH